MLFNQTSKIIKDKNLLSIDYIPKNIVGREKEIKDISFYLSYFFRDNPSLPEFTIYGPVGTGKTAVTNYVFNEFINEINTRNLKFKLIKIRGSENKTKFEVLKQILIQISPDSIVMNTKSDIYSQIIKILSERGLNILIFIDEIHELNKKDLNDCIYTISRFGEDLAYVKPKKGITPSNKSHIGYIFISNDLNLREKLKDNTKSSFVHDNIFFKRYDVNEIVSILKDRIEKGALFEDKIEEGALNLMAALSVQEGQDARYALRLISNVSREAEKRNMENITIPLVKEVNETLKKNLLKEDIENLSVFHLQILKIIYNLNKEDKIINSKIIYDIYNNDQRMPKREFSRICQIITDLEKNDIVYVTTSKSTRLRNISIEENLSEIKEVLFQKGYI